MSRCQTSHPGLCTATGLLRDRTQRDSPHVGGGINRLYVQNSGAQQHGLNRAVANVSGLVCLIGGAVFITVVSAC